MVHLHHFSKIKSHKKSQNSRNHGFSDFLGLNIEGSGSRSEPMTNGSGSRRPKNVLIRIRYTARQGCLDFHTSTTTSWVNYNYRVCLSKFSYLKRANPPFPPPNKMNTSDSVHNSHQGRQLSQADPYSHSPLPEAAWEDRAKVSHTEGPKFRSNAECMNAYCTRSPRKSRHSVLYLYEPVQCTNINAKYQGCGSGSKWIRIYFGMLEPSSQYSKS
jgi:hypothetical protein